MQKTYIAIIAGLVALVALASTATAAGTKGGRGIVKTGSCSANSNWKLKAKNDDGRIETEFEVDSNRVGQQWNVVIKDNGVIVFSGSRTTQAPSGSFEVRRLIANRAGTDAIVASAKNPATGESCVARASI